MSRIRKSPRRWSTLMELEKHQEAKRRGWVSLQVIGNPMEAKNGMLVKKTPVLMPTSMEKGKPWQEEEL